MGYFLGLDSRQFYIDDDGVAYNNVNKQVKVAENEAELIELYGDKREEKEEDLEPKAKFVCKQCGFFTNYKIAYVNHMKKHKVKVE